MRQNFDVLIVGGGILGMSMALGLAKKGLQAVVIESDANPKNDGRSYALALSSVDFLKECDVWHDLAPKTNPIGDIKIMDGEKNRPASRFSALFHGDEMEEGHFGVLAEDRDLRPILYQALEKQENAEIIMGQRVIDHVIDESGAKITLQNGKNLCGKLLISAEGAKSAIAQREKMAKLEWSYDQYGLVVNLTHEKPHNNKAYEYFLPSGPFALLPLCGHRSALVWTEKTKTAKAILKLDREKQRDEIQKHCGDLLGQVEMESDLWAYPLKLSLSYEWVRPRLALMGDSARAIHPIAGQGLNHGFKDAKALLDTVVGANRIGLDIGSLDLLEQYQTIRRPDSVMICAMTDLCNRFFSNDNSMIRIARQLGLGLFEKMPGLKKIATHYASKG